jgi:hypothetical protein
MMTLAPRCVRPEVREEGVSFAIFRCARTFHRSTMLNGNQ